MLYCFVTQKSRYRRNGHCGLEEHDLVSPAPDRGGLPRTGHAATTDPPHRAAAQACEAGLVRHRPVRAPARARAPAPAIPKTRHPARAPRPPRPTCAYHYTGSHDPDLRFTMIDLKTIFDPNVFLSLAVN